MPSDAAQSVEDWRARARQFAERSILPHDAGIDRDDRMPPSIREELATQGFMGLGIDPSWGGTGGGAGALAAVLEELARANAAVATLLSVHLSVAAAPIAQWGSEGQRETYLRPLATGSRLGAFALTEPGAGSDTAHLTTRYSAVDGGYRLRGTKMFITNGASADTVLTFATRDPSLGHRGISAFLVDRGVAGYSVAQHLDKLGLRGSETTELVFDDVAVGIDARLGPEGSGLKVALGALAGGRVGIAACALGVAQAAFDELRRQAERRPSDATRSEVARAFTLVSAARALVTDAAQRKDEGRPFALEASSAKLFASSAAVQIASKGVEVAGPEGVRVGARPERLLRDARVFPIVEGTTEIQELILGRALLGGPVPANEPSA